MAGRIVEAFTATGQSDIATVKHAAYSVSGTFVGTVELQRQLNGNWHTVKSLTAAELDQDMENAIAVPVRFNCTAYTSGTITCELEG